MGVHLLLAERCHFLYLLVIALHLLLILRDLLGIEQLVGRRVLKRSIYDSTSPINDNMSSEGGMMSEIHHFALRLYLNCTYSGSDEEVCSLLIAAVCD